MARKPMNLVRDAGNPHIYRTEIPNIVLEMGLTPYELALYVTLKRTTGDNGECYKSTATLAKESGLSVGMVSKVKMSLAQSRPEIGGKALIEIRDQENKHGGIPHHEITIVDIWAENMARFAKEKDEPSSPYEQASSPYEQASSHGEQASSPYEQASSHGEPKNKPNKKNPIRRTQEEEGDAVASPHATAPPKRQRQRKKPDEGPPKPPSPHHALFGAICDAIGWDPKVISETDKANVGRTATALQKAGYTADDIPRFMVEVWFKDWRWSRDQARPTLNQLRQAIGKLRTNTLPVEPPYQRGNHHATRTHNSDTDTNGWQPYAEDEIIDTVTGPGRSSHAGP